MLTTPRSRLHEAEVSLYQNSGFDLGYLEAVTKKKYLVKVLDRTKYPEHEIKVNNLLVKAGVSGCETGIEPGYVMYDLAGCPSILMEKAEFCLADIIMHIGLCDKTNWAYKRFVCYFFVSMSNALITLNQNDLVHGDINPKNILLKFDEEDNLAFVLSDFGSAKYQTQINQQNISEIESTPGYIAPEILKTAASKFDNQSIEDVGKIDIYSIGVVLKKIFFPQQYSESSSYAATIYDQIKTLEDVGSADNNKQKLQIRFYESKDFSSKIVILIQLMTSPEPEHRISYREFALMLNNLLSLHSAEITGNKQEFVVWARKYKFQPLCLPSFATKIEPRSWNFPVTTCFSKNPLNFFCGALYRQASDINIDEIMEAAGILLLTSKSSEFSESSEFAGHSNHGRLPLPEIHNSSSIDSLFPVSYSSSEESNSSDYGSDILMPGLISVESLQNNSHMKFANDLNTTRSVHQALPQYILHFIFQLKRFDLISVTAVDYVGTFPLYTVLGSLYVNGFPVVTLEPSGKTLNLYRHLFTTSAVNAGASTCDSNSDNFYPNPC